ncbi:MAG: hypothetical protein GEV06_16145 [Luteitalea sp.]|nr:hypothetical protein [Luteitalea sp.]
MANQREERIRALLQQALPPVDLRLRRDLWPRMARRLDEPPRRVSLVDWVLVGGLVATAAFLPEILLPFLSLL